MELLTHISEKIKIDAKYVLYGQVSGKNNSKMKILVTDFCYHKPPNMLPLSIV